ncbi:MAG: Ig-like domain-containing protein [Eubacteriales bacterium]
MKKNRRIITLILVAGMLLSFVPPESSPRGTSTSDAPETTDGAGFRRQQPPTARLVAKQEYAFTKLGETDVLSATVGGVSVYDVGYTSGDESVAAVVGNAVVAMGSGMTTITATRGSDTVVMTVNVNTSSKVVIAGDDMVPLNTASNPTAALTAAVEVPTVFDKTDAGVTWTSSNPEVATVDADGNVTAVGTGVAVITASSNYQITTTTVQSMMGMSITSTDTAIADDKVVVMVNNEFDAEKNKEIMEPNGSL